MEDSSWKLSLFNWLFGILLITIGIANLILVHPVPGMVYLLLSCIYLPPAYAMLRKWFYFQVPTLVKLVLGLAILWFTLGVSDLGDMIG